MNALRKKAAALLCAAAVTLSLFAGCAKAPAGSGSTADPDVEMERVPVVDTSVENVLNDFDIVGGFHNGVAFAANYKVPKTEEELEAAGYQGSYEVECGYVTLDGDFTELYTVPYEYELLGPESDFFDSVRDTGVLFYESFEGGAIVSGTYEEFLEEIGGICVPYASEQRSIDETFAIGENGWVPYYENGMWGYCDLEGNVTLAPAYDFVEPFIDGQALVCMFDGTNYSWSLIDETGAQKTAFEPCESFAVRQPGSDFILFYSRLSNCELRRLDGTQVDETTMHQDYIDSGTGVLTKGFSKRVYDTEGNLLYEDDRIQYDTGVQDGCTAYTDGTYFGILGSDGTVRCEARFIEILHLAPEGFYAREQGKTGLGLYDYDGKLIEEAPACAWVTESTAHGYEVYDGEGNLLAEYPGDYYVEMYGSTFFTEDGFAYLRLSDTQFVTLHIVFEERPVETTGAESTSVSETTGSGTLTVTQGASIAMWSVYYGWDFTVTGYDSMPLKDRVLFSPKEGLDYYYTPDYELIICDKDLNTVFAVPQEAVEYTTSVGGDNVTLIYPTPELYYLGDGLWKVNLSKWVASAKEYATVEYVFNRNGEVIRSLMQQGNLFPRARTVSEGYFSAGDQIFSVAGVPLEIKAEGEPVFSEYPGVFSGGLATTAYGYADTQGNIVISAEMLQQALDAYPGAAGQTPANINMFEGDAAVFEAMDAEGEIHCYLIDRTGKIVSEMSADESADWLEFNTDPNAAAEYAAQILAPFERDTSRGAFRIVARREGSTVMTPSGAEVFAPEGYELTGETVQWDEAYAFVEVQRENSRKYMLIDAQGNFYPECAWDGILPAQDGSANVFNRTGTEEIQMTHIEIAAS